jgi:16S rRNA (cytosine967-C5)-methyltransferase
VIELKPRQIAVQVLQQQAAPTDYVENLLETALNQGTMTPADRRLTQELVFGAVRWQAALDWLIDRKTGGRTQKLTLRILLRLGLYQMFWLERIPNYAAVHETVELAKRLGFGPQAGFLNAVLRAYGREREATEALLGDLKRQDPSLGYSHPRWLCDRWAKRWDPERMTALLRWNNTPPPTFARLNRLKANADQLEARWKEEGVQAVARAYDWTGDQLVFELTDHPPFARLPSFQEGWFYVQDPSTLLAVQAMKPEPGQTILDWCAAPGGKTTYLAQRLNNQGQVVAHDLRADRLERIRENCARLGVTCVRTVSPSTFEDQSAPAFDGILVDAPCSNTGVMRRRVDLRCRLRPEELERLRLDQLRLLRQVSVWLKPGGALVYSTCSLEPEENTQVIHEFLAHQPGFGLESERNLLPFVDGVDGAYVARLRRAQ